MTAPAGDWLGQAQDYAQRTGAEPRFIYVWLLTEIEAAHPGAVSAALACLPQQPPATAQDRVTPPSPR
jgi:hypothetical protein